MIVYHEGPYLEHADECPETVRSTVPKTSLICQCNDCRKHQYRHEHCEDPKWHSEFYVFLSAGHCRISPILPSQEREQAEPQETNAKYAAVPAPAPAQPCE